MSKLNYVILINGKLYARTSDFDTARVNHKQLKKDMSTEDDIELLISIELVQGESSRMLEPEEESPFDKTGDYKYSPWINRGKY